MTEINWNGQNIPIVHNKGRRDEFTILPVLEFILDYDDNSIIQLLPDAGSFRLASDFKDAFGWFQGDDRAYFIIPDFNRFGGIPHWFPDTDCNNRPLTKQGQVDRFLYLLDQSFGGGLPDDHKKANPRYVVEAILQLIEYMIDYISEEESAGLEWELESEK